jgi:tetratricopeptide (TPR) repeat protein
MLIAFLCLYTIPAMSAIPRMGVGPFQITMADEVMEAKLLRRDHDLVWILRKMQSGDFVETAIPANEITNVTVERPRVFEAVETSLDRIQKDQALSGLQRICSQLEDFRDLPGIPVDEALYLEGRIHEQRNDWQRAIRTYHEIMKGTYPSDFREPARIRAGLTCEQIGEYEKALELLDTAKLSDDNMNLYVETYRARGRALQALEKYEQATFAFLHLLVFYPYTQNNERYCLEAVLPCYAGMKDWEALYKTYQALQNLYPESDEAARATDLIENYRQQIANERQYQAPPEQDL